MIRKFLILAAIASMALAHGYLRPRQKAPAFEALAVQDDKTFKVSLNEFDGNYLVLLFYPFDFTYVCPTELISFSDTMEEFKKLNTAVLGISTDSHFSHLAWIKTPRKEGGIGSLNYPLLSDFSKSISRDYGFLVDDVSDDLHGAALRGLVIIDGKGVVRHMQVNDAPVGRSVTEVIRLIQAFKHTDEHGDVCPANWKPGSRTITPTQKDKLDYFNKEF